jgi:Rhodopirellula transposase DDE domain
MQAAVHELLRRSADQLEQWWLGRKQINSHVWRLMIDLDNGPEVSSSRRQFMKRLNDFSNRHGIEIDLVYYPPYHSKYNLIERCWGILEQHWNGTQLKTIQDAVNWASQRTFGSPNGYLLGNCLAVRPH